MLFVGAAHYWQVLLLLRETGHTLVLHTSALGVTVHFEVWHSCLFYTDHGC
jgi:hypothetical protein